MRCMHCRPHHATIALETSSHGASAAYRHTGIDLAAAAEASPSGQAASGTPRYAGPLRFGQARMHSLMPCTSHHAMHLMVCASRASSTSNTSGQQPATARSSATGVAIGYDDLMSSMVYHPADVPVRLSVLVAVTLTPTADRLSIKAASLLSTIDHRLEQQVGAVCKPLVPILCPRCGTPSGRLPSSSRRCTFSMIMRTLT